VILKIEIDWRLNTWNWHGREVPYYRALKLPKQASETI
jgi:hypothetical protein